MEWSRHVLAIFLLSPSHTRLQFNHWAVINRLWSVKATHAAVQQPLRHRSKWDVWVLQLNWERQRLFDWRRNGWMYCAENKRGAGIMHGHQQWQSLAYSISDPEWGTSYRWWRRQTEGSVTAETDPVLCVVQLRCDSWNGTPDLFCWLTVEFYLIVSFDQQPWSSQLLRDGGWVVRAVTHPLIKKDMGLTPGSGCGLCMGFISLDTFLIDWRFLLHIGVSVCDLSAVYSLPFSIVCWWLAPADPHSTVCGIKQVKSECSFGEPGPFLVRPLKWLLLSSMLRV